MKLIVAVAIAIIIYCLQKYLYGLFWSKNLDVDLRFAEEYVRAGSDCILEEEINNAKALPLPVFHVKFSTSRSFKFADNENVVVTDHYHRNDVFSVLGNKKITRRLSFTATERGLYGITTINAIARDFFMTSNFAKNFQSDTWLYVLPKRIEDLQIQAALNQMLGDYETRFSLMEDPFTFRGIRDYNHGDLMRRVNWKASAKTGELKVNVYQYTVEQKIKIMLNLEMNTMVHIDLMREKSIELASTVAHYFLENKIPTMFCSNGIDLVTGECEQILPGASYDHEIAIDKCLARIQDNAGLEHFMHMIEKEVQVPDKSLSYVIIASYYKEDLLRKLDYLKSQGCQIFMLVPYFDFQDRSNWRSYMHGWEVKVDES